VTGRPPERHRPLGIGWPNVLSIGRIVLVPVIVGLLVAGSAPALWAAFGLFALGAASDFLDGYLARRHEMTTTTGAWLDPLSDKLFVAAPAIVLAAQGSFPVWAAVLIVGREILVALLRWRLDKQGVSMPASKVAKAKTVSQLAAVGMAIAPLSSAWDRAEFIVVLTAVVLTAYSGAEYFLSSRHRVEA